ncbi:nitroreductase family protein [Haploplasma axanthum]|uniref:NAD(P)H nitroreductase yodC n=1 Tax=Haploplasma axanthum TaxID=29552 RepID=A0A449BEB2_HAPAX|nr:nitroreductase family protein [Haploplasma axanthum]VEU80791.1 Putative NAD(P)H nitroreductase yodC [Haploplasma axanthum]
MDFKEIKRKSIRVYDDKIKINKDEMKEILNEAAKAPSSVNMQPWRVAIVESKEGKELLRPLIRFNTRQNDTSAAMLVIFGDMKCYEYADEIYNKAVNEGKMDKEVSERQLATIVPYYKNFTRQKMNDVVKIDASLFAMQLMLVAKEYGYDTCPIGGFEEDKIADALGYDSNRYVPVLIVSIGKAIETGYDSVRLEAEKFSKWI